MRQKLLTGLGLVVVAAFVAGCTGHGHASWRGKHRGWHDKYSQQGKSSYHKKGLEQKFFHKAHMILGHQSVVGLSVEQADAIETLKLETKKTIIKQQADVEILALDLKAALKADKADSQHVNQLIDKKYAIKADKAKALATAYIELKGTLTPYQKGQLKNLWRSEGKGKSRCSKQGCSLCKR